MKFLVINGPNLNLTQFTEPGMEGQIDFNTLLDYIEAGCAQMDVQVDFFQSNHEGITAWPFWKRCRCAACPPWK